MTIGQWVSLISVLILLHYIKKRWSLLRLRAKMPPGPALNFFGDNRSCVPAIAPWEAFENLNRCYGLVVSFFLGSTPVVVLGSAQAAWDLLEKRGDIYSSRPRNIMANEILSGGMRGIGMLYGPRWRRWRALQQSALNIQASATYRVLQTIESSILLRELLKTNDPESYRSHMMRYAISVTFCVAYGRRVEELDVPLDIANQRIERREYLLDVVTKLLCETQCFCHKWRPIAPTGVAHSVTEDSEYNGMFIPRGSNVYANI